MKELKLMNKSDQAILPYCFSLQYARKNSPDVRYLYDLFVERCIKLSRLTPPDLADFPEELLRLIFEYLPWKSSLQAGMVCKEWRTLCSEEQLWRQYCVAYYHVSRDSLKVTEPLSSKDLFRNVHKKMKQIIRPSSDKVKCFTLPYPINIF